MGIQPRQATLKLIRNNHNKNNNSKNISNNNSQKKIGQTKGLEGISGETGAAATANEEEQKTSLKFVDGTLATPAAAAGPLSKEGFRHKYYEYWETTNQQQKVSQRKREKKM